jgi:GT2 family glycosyltransferase
MFASGGSAMFDRALFLELGGFDPLFAPYYFEDVELSYRAWKRGLAVAYEPRSFVRHQFSSTIGPLARRTRRHRIDRVSHRNRLLLHWIHLQTRPWLFEHLVWVAALGVMSPFTLKPAFTGGLIDALRKLPEVLARRREERARAVRTDRDVIELFRDLERSGQVQAFDDWREVAPS